MYSTSSGVSMPAVVVTAVVIIAAAVVSSVQSSHQWSLHHRSHQCGAQLCSTAQLVSTARHSCNRGTAPVTVAVSTGAQPLCSRKINHRHSSKGLCPYYYCV